MHDEFDKKREVVASLMKMLGKNAHDEVSNSMAPPKPTMPMGAPAMADGGEVGSDHDDDVKGMGADVTIVLPEGHGEHPIDDSIENEMPVKPEDNEMYALTGHADGGMIEEPKEDDSIEEQDMDNNSSTPFESLMKRAKRMK